MPRFTRRLISRGLIGFAGASFAGSCNIFTEGTVDVRCGAALNIVDGDKQEAQSGSAIANELVVVALVTKGTASCSEGPSSGQQISWKTSSGGTVTALSTTDGLGHAKARWTLGTTQGEQTVTATWANDDGSDAVTATFVAVSLSAPYTVLRKVAGDGQTGSVSLRLPIRPEVELKSVRDAGPALPRRESPIGRIPVQWAVLSGGGTIASPSVVTELNGHVAQDWTLGPTIGAQSARASATAPGAPNAKDTLSVTFAVTANAEPVRAVTLTPNLNVDVTIGQPKSIVARTFISSPLVEVNGRTVSWETTNASVATVSPASGPSPSTVNIVGHAIGTADITATSEGVKATIHVSVTGQRRQRIAYVRGFVDPSAPVAADAFNSAGGAISMELDLFQGGNLVRIPNQATLPGETETILLSTWARPSSMDYYDPPPPAERNFYCKLGDEWTNGASGELVARVFCFHPDGRSVSSSLVSSSPVAFSVLLLGDGALGGRFSFALADQPTAQASYTPAKSYNAGGLNPSPVSVSRTGTGKYSVVFPGNGGGATDPEAVHVSAVGRDNTRCSVSDVIRDTVRVHCFSPLGPPMDSKFTVTLLDKGPLGTGPIAYAWAVDDGENEFEQPVFHRLSASHAFNPFGDVHVTRGADEGLYEVTFANLSGAIRSAMNFQVVNRDIDQGKYCSVVDWAAVGADLKVRVQCFSETHGEPEDEGFYLIVVP